jgi:predicted nuclease with RNAse H fold
VSGVDCQMEHAAHDEPRSRDGVPFLTETVVGVDVSVRRGLDVVLLDHSRCILDARSALDPAAFKALLAKWRPTAVAIDSPPGCGRQAGASSRRCERDLRAIGVNIFLTPSDPDRYARPFYDWIRVGERVYRAAENAGYPLQSEPTSVRNRSLEVFPHASDVFLRGGLPPAGTTKRVRTKRAWRLATLHDNGVDTNRLSRNHVGQPTLDSIDAALAALTALFAVNGDFTVVGDASEWIVLPGSRSIPFERFGSPSSK